MEDAWTPGMDAAGQPVSAVTVAAIVNDALRAVPPANEEALSALLARAEDGTLAAHMTDGELRALADELIRTCRRTGDED